MISSVTSSQSPASRILSILLFMTVVVVATVASLANIKFLFLIVVASGFVTLAWRRPEIAVMIVFASAPFQNNLSSADDTAGGNGAFSMAEATLALSLFVFLFQLIARKRQLHLGPIAIPIVLYFTACLFSSIMHWRGQVALMSLLQMLLYLVAAIVVFSSFLERATDYRLALNGLVCVGSFLSVMAIATGFGFLGMNKNGLGSSLTAALLVAVELWFAADKPKRKAWLQVAMSVIAAGLLMSLSRGAWFGAICGLLTIVGLRRQFILAVKVGVILAILVALVWQHIPDEKKDYATDFSSSRYTIHTRIVNNEFAQKRFEQSPIFGVGAGLRKEYDATNVFMSTLAETGMIGLALFLLIHGVFIATLWRTQKLVSHNDPLYSFLTIAGALVFSKMAHGAVDHYWSRGHVMLAWASAGMAAAVYYEVKRRKASQELVA